MSDERAKAIATLREMQRLVVDAQAQERISAALSVLDAPAQLNPKDGSRAAEFWLKVPKVPDRLLKS